MKRIIKNYIAWVPALIWMGLIFYSSSLSDPLPGVGKDTVTMLSWPIHALEYGGLAFWLIYGQTRGKVFHPTLTSRILLTAFVGAVIYGVTDEFHQRFIPGRTFRALDMGVDAFGALIAIAAVWFLGKRKGGRLTG